MADNVSGRRKGKDIIIKPTPQGKVKIQGGSDSSVPVISEGDNQCYKKSEGTRTKSSDASVYVCSEGDKQRDKKSEGMRTKSSDASVYVSSEGDKQRDKKSEGTRSKSFITSVYVSSDGDKQRDKKSEEMRTKNSDASVYVSSEADKQLDKKSDGKQSKSVNASWYVTSKANRQRDKKSEGTRTKSSDASVYVSSEADKKLNKNSEGTRSKSFDASVYASSEVGKQFDNKSKGTRTKSSDTSVYVSSEEDILRDKKSEGTPTKISDALVYVSSEEDTLSDKKSAASGYKSSEEYQKCDPCKNVGDNAMAEWFCSGCKIYFCSTCFVSHLNRESSKNHAKAGKDDMSPRKSPKFCTACKKFGAEVKPAGYCEDCCFYLCDECCKCHSRDELTKNHLLKMDKAVVDGIGLDAAASLSKTNIKDKMTGEESKTGEFTFVRDIKVASYTDKKEECLIIDMTLVSDNELVLCDAFNKCLKLVDITKDSIKDVLPLQSKPLAVTAMSNDQIAVVLKDCYLIQILDTRGKLVINRTIKTNGVTASVRMVNKHFYVSFWMPVKFQKLQPTGSIIKTIKPDDEVQKHCVFPHNFAVNTNETVLYVADGQLDKVMSIDMNGNMLNLYQGELECPYSIIIVPSGSVYVCNRNQHIVYKMKSDLSDAIVILGPGDGITGPQAMYLNANDQHLYISSGSFGNKRKNFLKVCKC